MMDADLPDLVRALVIARDVSTPYLSAGRGIPILVLSRSSPVSRAVLRALPRRFRALAPTIPSNIAAAGLGAWLEGFLDALGIGLAWGIVDAGLAPTVVGDRLRIAGTVAERTHLDFAPDTAFDEMIAQSVALIDHAQRDNAPPLTEAVPHLS